MLYVVWVGEEPGSKSKVGSYPEFTACTVTARSGAELPQPPLHVPTQVFAGLYEHH